MTQQLLYIFRQLRVVGGAVLLNEVGVGVVRAIIRCTSIHKVPPSGLQQVVLHLLYGGAKEQKQTNNGSNGCKESLQCLCFSSPGCNCNVISFKKFT